MNANEKNPRMVLIRGGRATEAGSQTPSAAGEPGGPRKARTLPRPVLRSVSSARLDGRRRPAGACLSPPVSFDEVLDRVHWQVPMHDPPEGSPLSIDGVSVEDIARNMAASNRQALATRALEILIEWAKDRPLAIRIIEVMREGVMTEEEQAETLGVPLDDIVAERDWLLSLRRRVYTALVEEFETAEEVEHV